MTKTKWRGQTKLQASIAAAVAAAFALGAAAMLTRPGTGGGGSVWNRGGVVTPVQPSGPLTIDIEFATDGGGLGSVCACAPVSSTDGHPLLFSGGATYCTRGSEFTGIQPGDMTLCAANQPRIMPGGDGGGGLGIQGWDTRINYLTHSQQFDDSSWLTDGTTTVTANACLAPDGTMTADLVRWASNSSYIYQHVCPANYDVRLVYARAALADAGFDDGGVLDAVKILPGSGSGTPGVANWTFNSLGYTRLEQWDQGGTDIGLYFLIQNTSGAVQYACLWQADCQDNTDQSPAPYPPPIVTTTAQVSRAGDVPQFSPSIVPMRTSLSISAKLTSENSRSSASTETLVDANGGDGVNGNRLARIGPVLRCEAEAGATSTFAYPAASSTSDSDQLTCSYDGEKTLFADLNGLNKGDAGIQADLVSTGIVTLGSSWNGSAYWKYANGVLKNVSITSPSAKSIYLFGDSIVEAIAAGPTARPQYVIHNALGNRVSIQNQGHSGDTIQQCAALFNAQLNVVRDAGTASRSYFMLQCGINSSYDDGGTSGGAGNVLAQIETLLLSAQSSGVHVLGSTITPVQSGAAFVEAVNAPLRTFGTIHGIPIAETFRAMESPPDSGRLNPAYDFGDGEHPNDAGAYVESVVWIQTGGW